MYYCIFVRATNGTNIDVSRSRRRRKGTRELTPSIRFIIIVINFVPLSFPDPVTSWPGLKSQVARAFTGVGPLKSLVFYRKREIIIKNRFILLINVIKKKKNLRLYLKCVINQISKIAHNYCDTYQN